MGPTDPLCSKISYGILFAPKFLFLTQVSKLFDSLSLAYLIDAIHASTQSRDETN